MFDKFVSDKLRDHQSPVPPGLWEKIEGNKGNKPRAGVIPRTALWAGLIIIAAGTGIGLYMNNTKDSNNILQVEQPADAAKKRADYNGSAPSLNNNTAPVDENNVSTSTDQVNANDKSTFENNIRNNNELLPGKASGGNNMVAGNPVGSNDDRDDVINNKTSIGPGQNAGEKNSTPVVVNNRRRTTKTGNFTVAPIDSDEFDVAPVLSSASRISFTNRTTVYNFRSLAKNNSDQEYNLGDLSIIRIDCPPNGRERRNDWYLEVFGSPDLVLKSVSGSNSSFVSKKDSTESQQLSFTAGFRISTAIGENLLLKTGLQFSQINERFDLRTENERRIITVVTIRTVPGWNGADSTIRDTSTVEQFGYRLQRSYNRYRSIDIPVLLSYEFGGENLRFAINAGAIFNLRSWYSGNTLNDSMMVVSMNSKGAGVYKQNIGIGAYAGFSIMKPIGGKWDIFAEPYFRYNFSNMSRSDGYTQKFQAFGINLGLRHKIKGQRRGSK